MQWERDNPEKLKVNRKRTNDNRKDKLYQYGLISSERGSRKEWWRKNPDKTKEYIEKYSLKKSHEINEEEREICFRYFNLQCAYCGLTESESRKIYKQRLHRDHVFNKGSNKVDNCVPACKTCNTSKKEKELNEWFNDSNPHFTNERLIKINKWINDDWRIFIKVSN
jgi:5-methylcytosine-specific restriction endonuclease McrA